MKFTKDELRVMKYLIIYSTLIFSQSYDKVAFKNKFGYSFYVVRKILTGIILKIDKDINKKKKKLILESKDKPTT